MTEPKQPINTLNEFIVASTRNGLVLMNPPRGSFSADRALVLAAWLVAMAEHQASHTFTEVLEAVQST